MVYKGSLRESGVELLRYRISFVRNGEVELDELFGKIAMRAEEFCKGALGERARRAFEESDDPNKRFHFATFFYSLTAEAVACGRAYRTIQIEASLRRRGTSEPLQLIQKEYKWY